MASLNAKTIFVDASASSATPDGSSWTRAFVTLQDALAIATTGDEIRVARGAYYPDEGAGQKNNNRNSTFRLIEGITINGGYPVGGGPRDPFTNPTILSGDLRQNDQADFINNTDNAFNVLFADGTSTAVTTATVLDGLIIKGGNANSEFPNERGGGMRCNSASPTLNNCSFQGNSANFGGGIYSSSSSPTLNNCSFKGNNASLGGGIYSSSSSLTLHNCSFRDNFADSSGGTIYNTSSSPTLSECSFLTNYAGFLGGAIYNTSNSSPALNNCTFEGNSTSDVGGAIYNTSNSSPTLSNCSFRGNSANSGGGIYNFSFSSPTLNNCSFQGNSASFGGGIFNTFSSPTLNNCSFQGNNADLNGGGIFNTAASPILNNCIIWNNRDSSGTTTEDSSIFNDNSNPTYSYCLIANLSKASLDSDPSPKTNFDPSDPLFTSEIDPASAPTIGGNLRLLTGSPALNVGDDNSNSSATDLAGNPRKIGTIDLGAYEGGFVTFTSLGFTNPSGDDNNNGVTNYGDYAAGGDPTAPNDPSLLPKINDHTLTLSFRNNAADVSVEFQTSTDLLNWSQMIEGTDYNTSNSGSSTTGVRTTLTLELLSGSTSPPLRFYRTNYFSGG